MEQQVDSLNEKVKVRLSPSKVHGVGVFAIRDIAKGQKIYGNVYPQLYNLKHSYFDKLLPETKDLLLERWPRVVTGSNFFYPDCLIQAYCNHSDEPNYDAVTDELLRDVKTGEEILEDYRKILGYEEIYPWLKTVDKPKTIKKPKKVL